MQIFLSILIIIILSKEIIIFKMKRGTHHIEHIKKRKNKKEPLQSYPSKNKSIRFLDKIVLYLAFIAPIFELPQLIEIYSRKAAQDVSIITWGFFALMSIPWFIYGIIHKDKPIIILYLFWFLIDTAIVVGILMYS